MPCINTWNGLALPELLDDDNNDLGLTNKWTSDLAMTQGKKDSECRWDWRNAYICSHGVAQSPWYALCRSLA